MQVALYQVKYLFKKNVNEAHVYRLGDNQAKYILVV